MIRSIPTILHSRLQRLALLTLIGCSALIYAGVAYGQVPAGQGDCGFEDQYTQQGPDCEGDPSGSGSYASLTLTANPTSIQSGSAATLSWSWDASNYPETCTIDHGVGSVSPANGTGLTGGPVTVHPTTTTTYTMSCSHQYCIDNGHGGCIEETVDSSNGYPWSDSASVTVNPAPTPTITFAATPSSIAKGGSSKLTWSTKNATSCTGTGFSTGNATANSTGVSVSPAATQAYGISCTGPGGTSSASASVNVLSATCSVSPTTVAYGGSATWTAVPSGGTGSYTYAWSGTDSLTGTGISVAKAYATAGTKTASVTVKSGTVSYPVTCSNSLTVSNAADLTAGAVTPTTATAGSAVTLSAKISNANTAATGASFYDLFQRATDSSGTGATDIGTYSSAALAAGGSNTASKSYTFTSSGTYYVRACADKSSAGSAGVITESNESNNCGAWTKFTVNALPPTCSLSASPANNLPSTLSWSSTGATSCTGGGFSTGNATSGSLSVNTAGNYTLTCTGSGGTCNKAIAITQSCTNPAGSLSALPDRVQSGDTSVISYSGISGVKTSCTVTGTNGDSWGLTPASCTVPDGSHTTSPITTQTTYTITCDGQTVGQTVVNVIPSFTEF